MNYYLPIKAILYSIIDYDLYNFKFIDEWNTFSYTKQELLDLKFKLDNFLYKNSKIKSEEVVFIDKGSYTKTKFELIYEFDEIDFINIYTLCKLKGLINNNYTKSL